MNEERIIRYAYVWRDPGNREVILTQLHSSDWGRRDWQREIHHIDGTIQYTIRVADGITDTSAIYVTKKSYALHLQEANQS